MCMDDTLQKFKEDMENYQDAITKKHIYCGELFALSELVDELEKKKETARSMADHWTTKAVKYAKELGNGMG